VLRSATSETGQLLLERGQREALDSNTLIAHAAQAKRIYSEGNLTANPDRALPPAMATVRSELAVPMLLGDICLGVLDLTSIRPNAFDDSDLMAMHGVAQTVAHGLELARLAIQVRGNQEEIRALNRRYMAEAWGDLDQVSSDLSFSFDTSGAAVENLTPLVVSSATGAVPSTVTRSSDGSQVTAPLILREQVIGSLTLDTGTKELTADDLTFIEAVTTQAALALENARLYTELTQRATYLQTANEIARDASTTLDLNLLLRRVTELIRERFGFSHAAVYLMDEDGKLATIQAATGEGGTGLLQRGTAIQPGSGSVVGHVLSSGNHYAANHVEQDPFFQPDPLLPETRSELAIPLRVAGQVIGVIDIHSAKPNAFGEDEITILQTLSGQVAVAVQNARLFSQVSHRAERERKVVDITSRIRSTNDVSTILQTAVSELRRALGISNAAVMVGPMRDVKGNDFKPGT
jgi:GAF domain-containing protein